ncbi:MAG TPA: chemotaxis protein CheA [Bacteroidales bacterium]|nr:chemotaxis protein CheA [Bacteroidales bacterium]
MIDEFIQGFVTEAKELLMQLEDDLMRLEQNPLNPEIINSIFRIMHTLKGSAGMVGFRNIQGLTHEFENLYSKIRDGELKADSRIIDTTLKAKDTMLAMLDGKKSEADYDLKRLHNELDTPESVSQENETDTYVILFTPDKNVFERGLKPENSIEELKQSGQLVCIIHDKGKLKNTSDREKICTTSWEVYLRSTVSREQLNDIFLFYEQDEFCVLPVTAESIEPEGHVYLKIKKLYKNKKDITAHIRQYLQKLPEIVKEEAVAAAIQEPSNQVQAETVKTDTETTVNVSSHKLDELMNLVSELVTETATVQARAMVYNDSKLNNALENIEKLTKKFRNNALDLRLIPVGSLLNKFKRQVRDLSRDLGKNVQLLIEGQDIEIDKTILKSIESPLQHIIRNSIDHGIEFSEERLAKGKKKEGLLKITAFYSGASVIIQVQDDGSGINLDRVRECAIKKGFITQDQVVTKDELITMIMEPGFTTNENVSIVSGRGVGMDVVRKELNGVGGSLEVFTEKDLGTSITMKLPTTLTIVDTLMVNIAETKVLIPVMDIEYCYREKQQILNKRDNRYLEYKNHPIPLVSLREQFRYTSSVSKDQMVVVINKFDRRYAIIADEIVGEHQAVIKPLGELFVNQPYFSGGSILVDGDLAFILDTNFLFNHITKLKD